jgi:hypothetical protein
LEEGFLMRLRTNTFFKSYRQQIPPSPFSTALDSKINAPCLEKGLSYQKLRKSYVFKSLDVTKFFGLVATLPADNKKIEHVLTMKERRFDVNGELCLPFFT